MPYKFLNTSLEYVYCWLLLISVELKVIFSRLHTQKFIHKLAGPINPEEVVYSCSIKIYFKKFQFIKISEFFFWKTPVFETFFNNASDQQSPILWNLTPKKIFSFEIFRNFLNNFLWKTSSNYL